MKTKLIFLCGTLCLSGCLPELKDQCGDDSECGSGVCTLGVCVPPSDSGVEADGDTADVAGDGQVDPDTGTADEGVDPGDAVVEPDMAGLDMAQPDMGGPDPDMRVPDPDMRVIDPDMRVPDPDMMVIEPDLGPPDPDVGPAGELCNALDDDGDGRIDEDVVEGVALTESCYTGPAAVRGIGICRDGVQECVDGEFGECVGDIQPQRETCDDLDEDCDGRVDEGVHDRASCYTGPEGTVDVGTCRSGVVQCLGGREVGCNAQVLPTEEVCDALDNDCDGEVDEGDDGEVRCECDFEGERECYTGPEGTLGVGTCQIGLQACLDIDGSRRSGPCEGQIIPTEETCAEGDNDCDGAVDEFSADNAICSAGVGGCLRQGNSICRHGEQACDVEPGAPGQETCNNIDDDCDGITDEAVTVACDPVPPNGPCRAGARSCAAGVPGDDCIGRVEPQAVDLCDGQAIDEDCDGQIDEGCECEDGFEAPCGPEQETGACRRGTTTCAGGAFGECVGSVEPANEVCNEVDDDCNGTVDDVEGFDEECSVGLGECLRLGRRRCSNGQLACNEEPGEPQAEVCNNRDDDCDGEIDEELELGPCTVGQGTCAAEGNEVCDGDQIVCDAVAGEPREEQCDEQDDDCDGLTDEGFNVGDNCDAGFELCNVDGSLECVGGEAECVANFEPSDEVCDTKDNDCDGQVDEGLGLGEACEDADTGCRGELQCGVGQDEPVCVGEPANDDLDLCDGLDSNCDGVDGEDDCANGTCIEGGCVCVPHWFDLDGDPTRCERGCGRITTGINAGGTLLTAQRIAVHQNESGAGAVVYNPGVITLVRPDGSTRVIADNIDTTPTQLILSSFSYESEELGSTEYWAIAARIQGEIRLWYVEGAAAEGAIRDSNLPGTDVSYASMIRTRDGRMYLAYLATDMVVLDFPPRMPVPARVLYLVRPEEAGRAPRAVARRVSVDDVEDQFEMELSDDQQRGVALMDDGSEAAIVAPVTTPGGAPAWVSGFLLGLDLLPFETFEDEASGGPAFLVGDEVIALFGFAGTNGAWVRPFEPATDHVTLSVDEDAESLQLADTDAGFLAFTEDEQSPVNAQCTLYVLDVLGESEGDVPFEPGQCSQVAASPQVGKMGVTVGTVGVLNRFRREQTICELPGNFDYD